MNITPTKAEAKRLPPLYGTEGIESDEKVLQIHFFNPSGAGDWYGVEWDGSDIFFGWATLGMGPSCDEWGYFSLVEMQGVKGRMGLGIERDLHWRPIPFRELKRDR